MGRGREKGQRTVSSHAFRLAKEACGIYFSVLNKEGKYIWNGLAEKGIGRSCSQLPLLRNCTGPSATLEKAAASQSRAPASHGPGQDPPQSGAGERSEFLPRHSSAIVGAHLPGANTTLRQSLELALEQAGKGVSDRNQAGVQEGSQTEHADAHWQPPLRGSSWEQALSAECNRETGQEGHYIGGGGSCLLRMVLSVERPIGR